MEELLSLFFSCYIGFLVNDIHLGMIHSAFIVMSFLLEILICR
jgi:hypothetical protein